MCLGGMGLCFFWLIPGIPRRGLGVLSAYSYKVGSYFSPLGKAYEKPWLLGITRDKSTKMVVRDPHLVRILTPQ